MKTLFTLLILAIGFSARAQQSSFSKEVTTDGQQLRIRVDVEQPGRSMHYSRSFDVSELDARAVRALENQVLDSLDQAFDGRYAGVFTDRKRDSRYKKKHREDEDKADDVAQRTAVEPADESVAHGDVIEAKMTRELSLSETAPASVLVREDKENGRLWMQYTFKKDGDELVFERTANVLGKSESEKKAIIKETERRLGIKSMNQ